VVETTSLVLVLDRLAVALVAATNTAIAEVGAGDLSFAQWRCLMVVGGASEPLRLGEIAGRISASMPSTSRLVGRMERRGLVSSSRDPVDGRGRRIVLTTAGDDLRARVIGRRREMLGESLAGLGSDPDVTDRLAVVVDRLDRLV
jgi:DNA-binding MarR family transcriptional regulator